jgi:hypothetical protein
LKFDVRDTGPLTGSPVVLLQGFRCEDRCAELGVQDVAKADGHDLLGRVDIHPEMIDAGLA